MAKQATRKKKVYIDTKSVFSKISRDTGEKITAKSFCEEYGLTAPTITRWNREAPESITIIFKFLKKHDLKFEDLVKLG